MNKIAIIGFGRFGELLAGLAKHHFQISVIEPNHERAEQAVLQGYEVSSVKSIAKVDIIFVAVPISSLKDVCELISPFVQQNQLIVDLCSVKVYPAKVMEQYLSKCALLGSHPMFGPDSAKEGIKGLQVALCPINATARQVKLVRDFWEQQGADIIETTPEAHDRDAVYSQAFTYSLAHVIRGMDLHNITFTTRSFRSLVEVAELSANDSNQLFHDMLFYNPYFSEMKSVFEASLVQTNKILQDIETNQADAKLF